MKKFTLIVITIVLASTGLIANPNFSRFTTNESLAFKSGFAPMKANAIQRRNCFEQGTMVFSLGYGVPNLGKTIFKAQEDLYPENTTKATGLGPLFGKFEYGVSDKIGVGLVLRFVNNGLEINDIEGSTYDEDGFPVGDTTYNYKYSSTHFAALARFNYHFATTDNIDPYVGVGIGYGNTTRTADFGGDLGASEVSWSSLIPIGTELTIGMRYFFTDNIGAYAEIGFSKSVGNFGLSIKI